MNFHKENKYGKLQSVLILKLMHRDKDEVITEKKLLQFRKCFILPESRKEKENEDKLFYERGNYDRLIDEILRQ